MSFGNSSRKHTSGCEPDASNALLPAGVGGNSYFGSYRSDRGDSMPEWKEGLPPIEIPARCEPKRMGLVWAVQHIEQVT